MTLAALVLMPAIKAQGAAYNGLGYHLTCYVQSCNGYATASSNGSGYVAPQLYTDQPTTISIYLNPVHNVLNLATSYEVEAVQIAGIMGNVVYQQQGHSKQIAVATLPAGVYVARVTLANGRSVVARFTKQ